MKFIIWKTLSRKERLQVLRRSAQKQNDDIRFIALQIIEEIKKRGDSALEEFSEKFDNVALRSFRVGDREFQRTERELSEEIKKMLQRAARNIEKFHAAQKRGKICVQTMPGVSCELRFLPIEKVGLYVPGGTATLPSTVLMLGIPSKLAGCETRILCTPPRQDGSVDPSILYAAQLCGIREVYRIGGAQAIAAMAYGTKTVPKVDKIFGPGNAYVTEAKILVSQDPDGAAMDIPAGPSEVMILADGKADPVFVAADLLSQAEHDRHAQAILVTHHIPLAKKVAEEVRRQVVNLPRKNIAEVSLQNNGRIILVDSLKAGIEVINAYAPEHLILQIDKPEKYLKDIRHAGSIFLGKWTPEAVGDYASGTNHILPTYGYARAFGGVNLASFMKTMTVQSLTAKGLKNIAPIVEKLADLEELTAHRHAVFLRRKNLEHF
ncbi:MAG: histidinol dehydrogenase [Verrucomicrobiota bacterium]